MNLLCVIAGHKWRLDESTEVEPVLCCDRCGRKQVAPTESRREAKA